MRRLAVPGNHPSNYEAGATLLNFSDQADTDETTPYSVYNHTIYIPTTPSFTLGLAWPAKNQKWEDWALYCCKLMFNDDKTELVIIHPKNSEPYSLPNTVAICENKSNSSEEQTNWVWQSRP